MNRLIVDNSKYEEKVRHQIEEIAELERKVIMKNHINIEQEN